jgi:hypothetical protein
MQIRISKAVVAALLAGGLASTASLAGQINPRVEMVPTGKGWGEAMSGHGQVEALKPGGSAKPTNGITLHTGNPMLGTPNVYYIWYGTWGTTDKSLLTTLISNIGGSPYLNINKTYFDHSNVHVSGNAHYAGATTDAYSQGPASTSLSDTQIQNIVTLALNSGALGPKDANGIYFVLTSADVHKSGFGTSYCGWHTHANIGGTDVQYGFIGDPSVQYPANCGEQATGPNGSSGADAMASIVSHELEEAITDPDLNAWYDRSGAENADKCAWTFGTEYTTGNGAKANVNIGGKDWLIQQNWNYAATVSQQHCPMN